MATVFLDPGGDADFGSILWKTGGTAPTVATDFVHGGHIKSFKFSKSVNSYLISQDVLTDAGGRVSVWLYFNALPAATKPLFQIEQSNDGNTVVAVMMTSGGILQLANGNVHTQIGSNGSTLTTGVWYRLCLAWTITSTTVNQFRLFLNGTQDISVSNTTLTFVTTKCLQLGNGGADTGLDLRASDIYLDSSTALTDPGNIWVTAKRPNASGTTNQFTTQIGASGSGYGSGHSPQVNERVASDTNGWSISTTTQKTEEYNVEAAGTGDIDLSYAAVVDYMGWIRAKVDSTNNSPVHHIILNGVATAITLATGAAEYTAIAGSTVYPPGAGADIGMDAQYSNAHLTSLLECGIIVAYIPRIFGKSLISNQAVNRAATY